MAETPAGAIGIGDLALDPARGLLLRDGVPVRVRAKTFRLLIYLAEHPGRVVGKDELFEAVWPDVTVGDDTLTQTIRDLRVALGAEAGRLRTVPRMGYALDLPDGQAGAVTRPPRVAVLPFRTMSSDPEDSILADGLAEELTFGLGRYGQIEVVARHSAFRFRPGEHTPDQAARALDADYFVDGTVRRIGDALTVSLSLGPAGKDTILWGEQFALSPDTLAEVQAALPNRIASRLDADVEQRLGHLAATSATRDLGACGHFIAGAALLRSYGPGVNERGRAHLEQAIARDPGFGLAHAYLGLAELMQGDYGFDDPGVLDRAMAHARRGVTLAPDEARCHWVVAVIQMHMPALAAAETTLRRALQLNPHMADAMICLGQALAQRGKADEGLVWAERAFRLNPLHPSWYHGDLALILRQSGRYREAIAQLECWPKETASRQIRLAACHAALGEDTAAAWHVRRARQLRPDWDILSEADRTDLHERPEDIAAFRALVARAVAAADG